MEEVFEREENFLFWEFSEMVCQSNTFSGLYRPKETFQNWFKPGANVWGLGLFYVWQQNNLNSIGE